VAEWARRARPRSVPSEELSNLLSLARELAQMMDAEQNADDAELVEVRLLRAVERVEFCLDTPATARPARLDAEGKAP
jgi:hypothetical protein